MKFTVVNALRGILNGESTHGDGTFILLSQIEFPYSGHDFLNFLFSLDYGVGRCEPFKGIFKIVNTTSTGVGGGNGDVMGVGGGVAFSGPVAGAGGASDRGGISGPVADAGDDSGRGGICGPVADGGGGGGRDSVRGGTVAFSGYGNVLGGERGVSRLAANASVSGGPGASVVSEGDSTVGGVSGAGMVSESRSTVGVRPGARLVSEGGSNVENVSGAGMVSKGGSTMGGVPGDSVISEGGSTVGVRPSASVGDARNSSGGVNGSCGALGVTLDGVGSNNSGGTIGVRNDFCGIGVGGGCDSSVGSEPGASMDGGPTACVISGLGASMVGGVGSSKLNASVDGGSCTSVTDGPGANVGCVNVASLHSEHATDLDHMRRSANDGGRSGPRLCHRPSPNPPSFQSRLSSPSLSSSSEISRILDSPYVSGGGDVGVGGVMSADGEGGRSLINHPSSFQPSQAHSSSSTTLLSEAEANGANGLYNLKETGFKFIQTKNADDDASPKVRTCYSVISQLKKWNGAKLVVMNIDWTKKKEMENKEKEDDPSSSSVVSNIKRLNGTPRRKLPQFKKSLPLKTTLRSPNNSVPARRFPVDPYGKLRQATPVSSALHTEQVASLSKVPSRKVPSRKVPSFGMTRTSFSSMESKAGAGSGSQRKGVGNPATRSRVVSLVNKTKVESVRRGEMNALSDVMVKGVAMDDYHRLEHFFEFVDSVPAIKPDDNTKFFECLVLDAEIQKSWRMMAHYLMVSDKEIEEINKTSFFVEEKCMRVLQSWRKNDLSADYVEVMYAVINIKGYNPAREARPHMPLSSFDSRMQQSTRLVSVPLETKLLVELEKELTREKEKGMCEAKVILQGNHKSKLSKAMEFRLLTLDRDGLRMVEYACKGAAADNVKEVTLTINYFSITIR